MVLPIVDEAKPKCYLCYEGFDDIKALRKHIRTTHPESEKIEYSNRESAPGDVTVF